MHDLWCRDNLLKSSLGYVLLSFSYFPFSATDGPKCFFFFKAVIHDLFNKCSNFCEISLLQPCPLTCTTHCFLDLRPVSHRDCLAHCHTISDACQLLCVVLLLLLLGDASFDVFLHIPVLHSFTLYYLCIFSHSYTFKGLIWWAKFIYILLF